MFPTHAIQTPYDNDELYRNRCKRDVFEDLKIAIDCLKEFDDSLKLLHPDVYCKIRQLII